MMKDTLEPGEIVDKYKVVSHFMDGTFGPLYLVENLNVPVRSILKVSLPFDELEDQIKGTNALACAKVDHKERAINEANITARFNHPHIIKVVDLVDVHDKYKAVVYEHVAEPQNLEQVISQANELRMYRPLIMEGKKNFRFNNHFFQFAQQLNHAVDYIRGQGYLHKDLKPANVIVDSGMMIKIIDFGIANPIDDCNGIYANRLYSPPEFTGEEQHKNSDLWSNALIDFELLTGKYLFGEKDKQKVEGKMQSIWEDFRMGNWNTYKQRDEILDHLSGTVFGSSELFSFPSERYSGKYIPDTLENQERIKEDIFRSMFINPPNFQVYIRHALNVDPEERSLEKMHPDHR